MVKPSLPSLPSLPDMPSLQLHGNGGNVGGGSETLSRDWLDFEVVNKEEL